MANKEMKTLTVGEDTFEIVDERARNSLAETISYAETIDECTDVAKLYILPDGYIYEYLCLESQSPTIDIQEGHDGYWNKNGVWEDFPDSKIHCFRSSVVPVTPGDKLSYKGSVPSYGTPSVTWLDKDGNKIGVASYSAKDEPVEVTAPANAVSVWFFSMEDTGGTTTSLLEVEWLYCQTTSSVYRWINTGKTLVPDEYDRRITEVEVGIETLENANFGGRIDELNATVNSLKANAVTVKQSVNFEWTSLSHWIQVKSSNPTELLIVDADGNTNYGYAVMEVSEGEKYYIVGKRSWEVVCYAVCDENNSVLAMDSGAIAESPIEETFVIPAGAKYLYVSKYHFTSLHKDALVDNRISDPLFGKYVCYDGDSIAESRTNQASNYYNGGAYAKIIADTTYGTYENQAVGGGILRSASAVGSSAHSIVDNLANLPTNADLYCFEGGINDYWGNAELGTYNNSDFTGTLDTATVCGALETIFRYALNNFPGKPVCFVITHKIQSTAYIENSNGNTFEEYRDSIVGICKKHSIPYYDAFSESGLNGWNTVQNNLYLTSNGNGTGDGCHPNAEGYKRYYVPQLLSLFRKIMPVE